MESDIITIGEVATYLKLKEKTVYKLAAEDTVPTFKVGGSWRFSKTDIINWVEQQKQKHGGDE